MNRLALTLLMMPMLASGNPESWMRKENPNELGLWSFTTDTCPFSSDEIEEELANVLVRSRIKPVHFAVSDPYVYVNVQCFPFKQDPDFYSMMTTIDFVNVGTLADGTETYVRVGTDPHLGGLFRGRKEYLKASVREYMERIVADYLRANFDPREDE